MSDDRVIAALGSSFAAGPGITPLVNTHAQRSGRNYAHQLADRLGAHLVDLTVSGATTANVLNTPQIINPEVIFAPQLDALPADADIVTITAGGNDLEFAGAMLSLAWERTAPDSPLISVLGGPFAGAIPVPTPHAVAQAAAGLVRIVEGVRRHADRARVILVDYLTVLDNESLPSTPFTREELEQFLAIQAGIATAFRDAATHSGAELIAASTFSTSHALGSPDAWVQPFHTEPTRTFGSFHPNERGMEAIATQLENLLATTRTA